MSERSENLLIEDIVESAQKILSYTNGLSFDDFVADEKTVDAVVRNFEIIGEAASRLSPEFRSMNPHIEWNRIRGLRNRIVHDYFGIDHSIVWRIIRHFLPKLVSDISRVANLDTKGSP